MSPGVFRLFLAFVVVVHHSFPLRLGAWAVGMFFALSGFWISRMWRRKYSGFDSPIRSFYVSRWWRLAPLFLTVNLLAVVLVVCGQPVGNPRALESWQWWVTQPAIAGSTQFARLLPPAWSLDVEMQFYLVAPLLILGTRVAGFRGTVLLIMITLGWTLFRFARGATLEEPRLDLYLWTFLVGCCAESFEIRPSNLIQAVAIVGFITVIAVAMRSAETRELVWLRGDGQALKLPRAAHIGFYTAVVLLGLPIAIGTVYRRSGSWDRWMGDLSFPLYMFHWIPRDWYYSHVDWTRPWAWNAVLLLVNFVMATIGAILLLQIVDRPAQVWRERWASRKQSASAGVGAAISTVSLNN